MSRTLLQVVSLFFSAVAASQSIPDSVQYLGLVPPRDVPQAFRLPVTPGFFAAERIAISRDGREIYFGEINGYGAGTSGRIRQFKYANNKWNGPATVIERAGNPALSNGEQRLYLGGGWCCERTDTGWSQPRLFLEYQKDDPLSAGVRFGKYISHVDSRWRRRPSGMVQTRDQRSRYDG